MDVYELKDCLIKDIRKGIIRPNDNETLIRMVREKSDSVRKEIATAFLQEEGNNLRMNIWLYSFSIALYPNPMVLKNLIMLVRTSCDLDYKEKYFLFQQINSVIFKCPICNTDDIIRLAWGLLEDILTACKQALDLKLDKIPVSELNKGISVVLVEQYLTDEHGPTKTALDRCLVLKKVFLQDVMLINTAELMTPANSVYFEDASIANYFEGLSFQDSVSWKGETFRFCQCARSMPSDEGILELVSFIKTIKPGAIVLVGGTSLVAGILNELVPVITVGTIQSGLAMTLADYQIIDENMLKKGYELLEYMGKPTSHIIPGKFTFSLKTQTHHITREMMGIAEDAFALVVVGGRLTDEITDEFLCMLEQCMEEAPTNKKIVVGVVGVCSDLETKLRRHKCLIGKVINIGFVKDILSVIEHFDLYVNPIRRGGGTSVVEAMSKGLPVVTVDYGDVAGIVGPEFSCHDYKEMKSIILTYVTDENVYAKKSKLADKIASEYLDSSKEFARIMVEYYGKQGICVNKKPLLSVIVPCYNVEKYVERCLDSIVKQTIGIENLDVILVNDASTDQTISIIKKYEERYPNNIRVIDLEQNVGLSRARNIGIDYAATDFVTFVDSDDWIASGMYEDLYMNGIVKGCDLAMCGHDRPKQYEETIFSDGADSEICNIDNDSVRRRLLQEYRTDVYAWNKIYKKSYFLDYGIQYPEGLYYEDNYVGLLMLLLCKSIYITNKAYYHWFINPSGITGQNKHMSDRFKVQDLLFEKIMQMKLYDRFKNEIDYNYFEKVFVEGFVAYVRSLKQNVDEIEELKNKVLKQVPDIVNNPYFLGRCEIVQMDITSHVGKLISGSITEDSINKIIRDCTKNK